MCSNSVKAPFGSLHPKNVYVLLKSIKSFIESKLDYEKKTPEFIKELRVRLRFLFEYNSRLKQITQKYTWSKQFDLLLINYVELEYQALYNNPYNRETESSTEFVVLEVLRNMLYPTIRLKDVKDKDRALNRKITKLLAEVDRTYLVRNKLIYNIAKKLVKTNATSDYGTDSDSDFEVDVGGILLKTQRKNIDGVVPTIEFIDDDNYCVYLEKPKRRKCSVDKQDDCVIVEEEAMKPKGIVTFEILDDDEEDGVNYMVYLQKDEDRLSESFLEEMLSSTDEMLEEFLFNENSSFCKLLFDDQNEIHSFDADQLLEEILNDAEPVRPKS